MSKLHNRIIGFSLTAFACVLGGISPAIADDSEVFTSAAYTAGNSVRPNILFVIDTSGSMDSIVRNYDPKEDYDGPCDKNRVYWSTSNSEQPPACGTNQWVDKNKNTCAATRTSFDSIGWWRGRAAQFNPGTNQWGNGRAGANNDEFECQTDSGIHGVNDSSTARWARNAAAKWTTNPAQVINWGGRQNLSLYDGNYANWWYGTGPGTLSTRWEIVRDVAKALIDQLDGVNLGLMRYSTNAAGGMVVHPVSPLTTTNRTTMKALLDSYAPGGYTPLSETYYEATQYFRGAAVDYGNGSAPSRSAAGSRVGNSIGATNYDSPADFSCQNNFIVYLTDGLPTEDVGANAKIQALPSFATKGGSCDAVNPDTDWTGHGSCMVSLARYLHDTDLRTTVFGPQSVTTYMVGFGDDIAPAKTWLDAVAAAGGTEESWAANSVGGLANALSEIFSKIIEGKDVTFTSPTLSVNAFNRTRNLNDLYVSVFSPARGLHWPGNLKKYQVNNGQIVDANGQAAVDPDTGFFKITARSYWSVDRSGNPVTDGAEVTMGGASSQLPSYGTDDGSRKLFTYVGNSPTDTTDAITVANTATVPNTLLGIGGSSDPTRTDLINFVRGQDVLDANGNGVTDERRMRMGDPMHARPALVIYGGTAQNPEGVVYVPTNDGYLHAIDATANDNPGTPVREDTGGKELWAFIPREFLPRLKYLYADALTPNRQYGLDGDISVFKYDVDGDGIVESDDGDKVYLFFGFGRGGSVYYALDVTNKNAPELLWKKDASDLPGLGRAWSPPTIAKVNINGTVKYVLIIGGGYDEAQENYVYTTDSMGNRIFMLDLENGTRLWSAGPSGADLNHPEMNNSIPSRVTVIDIDGDKLADRMYVGDMGGRLWRFDIWNGQAAGALVTGGVIAKLGAGGVVGATRANTRRFYNAPDVAIIQRRGSAPFFNIAIGSGYRGHPLEQETRDRFYSVRDYLPFTKRTKPQYDTLTPVFDGNLVDVTSDGNAAIPEGSPGWKLLLNDGGSWIGEKVLAESVTVAGAILFPTFVPLGEDPEDPCVARTVNRAYALRVENGGAFFDMDDDESFETADRYSELKQSGIAAEISILINENISNIDADGDGEPDPPAECPDGQDCEPPGNTCLSGVEVLQRCVNFGSTVRSFWQRQ